MTSISAAEQIDEEKERAHFRAVVSAFKYYKLVFSLLHTFISLFKFFSDRKITLQHFNLFIRAVKFIQQLHCNFFVRIQSG